MENFDSLNGTASPRLKSLIDKLRENTMTLDKEKVDFLSWYILFESSFCFLFKIKSLMQWWKWMVCQTGPLYKNENSHWDLEVLKKLIMTEIQFENKKIKNCSLSGFFLNFCISLQGSKRRNRISIKFSLRIVRFLVEFFEDKIRSVVAETFEFQKRDESIVAFLSIFEIPEIGCDK